jgi:hypothetical protein
MIVSYRGFWAASLQLILFGPLARGSADNVVQRQAQTAPTTSIAAPAAPSPTVGGNTAEVSGTFFETTWNILPSAYTFGTPFDVIYTMSTSPDAIKNQNLTLVLLFTKATSGTPSAGNIYSVLSPKCKHPTTDRKLRR